MANLFIGFPVPRAKIADMITGEAAPKDHHADHEDGGSDEVDCTGLEGAGGISFPYGGLLAQFLFTSIDGFYQDNSGTGVITLDDSTLYFTSGLNADSKARLEKSPAYLIPRQNYDKNSELKTQIRFHSYTSATGNFVAVLGYDETYKHIGFKVLAGKLYGTVGNGSAETTVELQTLGAGAYDVTRDLKAVLTAGSKCEFFVDGTKVDEITTGLPTGEVSAATLLVLEASNPGVAEEKRMYLSIWNIWQEA